MTLNQAEQDRIWNHHQTDAGRVFDLSYPRLRFLAERCAPGTRVLNIGVGSGYLEALLVKRGVEVFSLDPSAQTIEQLQRRFDLGSRARQGYGQDIPFDAGSFDKVVMTEVLEHLPTNVLQGTLGEVRRVLKPGGELTGTVPYREDLSASDVICPRCETSFHRWGHAQRFDVQSMATLFVDHGFEVMRIYPRTFPDFRRGHPKQFLKAVVRYVLGRMGEPLVTPNLYFRVRRIER